MAPRGHRSPVSVRIPAVPGRWLVPAAAVLVLTFGCKKEMTGPGSTPAVIALALVSGDAQTTKPGDPLGAPLVVRLTADGRAVANQAVTWSGPAGAGTIVATAPRT